MRVVIGLIAVMLVCLGLSTVGVRSQVPTGPFQQFRGNYQITRGPSGTVRIMDALGGSYTEWAASFGQPSHEIRMLVGARNADGTFRAWRFEQEPAPAVSNEGTARLVGQELIADFTATTGPQGKMIRERWRLTSNGLEFDLEASAQGEPPRRVGGFAAIRQ
jgi:hypothetical protein